MEFIYNIAEYIANYFDAACAIIFLTCTLGKNSRISNKKVFLGIIILTVTILGYLQDTTTNSTMQHCIIFSICLIFELLFLNNSIGWKFLANIIFNLLLVFTNMFVMYILVNISHLSIEQLCTPGIIRVLVLLFHKTIFVVFLLTTSVFIRKKSIELKKHVIAMILFTGILLICSILINITKQGNLTTTQESQLLIITFGILAICIAVCICIYQLNQQYKYELENTRLLSRLQEEEYMLRKINEIYENNRILQHDLTRHFSIIQGLLDNGNIQETQSYISEITHNHLQHPAFVYTSSTILNTVLNNKAEQCHKKDISYKVTICGEIEESMQMNISIIISNLLDNAIAAECLQSHRQIAIYLSHDKGMYHIIVQNYIHESVLETNPSLITSKQDKKHHGIGIKSVRKIVHSLDGFYQQYEQNSYFITNIILPDSTNCA